MPDNKLWSITRIRNPEYPGITLRITELQPGGTLRAVLRVNGKPHGSVSIERTCKDLGKTPKQQEDGARAIAFGIIEKFATRKSFANKVPESGSDLTLGALADLYELNAFHDRSVKYAKEQPAKIHRIVKVIGRDRTVRSLWRDDVAKYTAARKAKGIKQGTIASDMAALKIMLNWATERPLSNGEPLLAVNPIAKVKIEHEKRPRRPVADLERYAALREVSDSVSPQLSLALDLAWHTGRRVSAMLGLRWGHVITDPDKAVKLARKLDASVPWSGQIFKNGAIRWYAGQYTDNKKRDHVSPINEAARAALDCARPDITAPDAWLFPSPQDPNKPLGYHVLKNMLKRAEKKADLEPLEGGNFHPFRRAWATNRKHWPIGDVALLGDWRTPSIMQESYVRPDAQTIIEILAG